MAGINGCGMKGGNLLFRVLLGGLGLVGAFVSMGYAILVCVVSQETPSTKLEWGILLGIICVASVICLLFAVHQPKQPWR
jgi:peptidoglycan/LPS O-acetylase OafA/YrhL